MARVLRVAAVVLFSICAMLIGEAPSQAATAALSINDVTVNEPNWPDWEAPAVFTVSLNRSAPKPVTVHWATSAPVDVWDPEIKRDSGTVTIPAGELQGTLTVTVLRETENDSNRQFTVTLSAPTNATIADGTGIGTIINSDRAGRFSCLAESGEARNTIAGISTRQTFGVAAGYDTECNYPDAQTYQKVSQNVAGATVTVSAFDVAVAPTPNGNASWDTRVDVGDGADALAKTGVITITAPGVDVRIETARSDAQIRCEALGAPPVMSGSGAVTGVTINGTKIDEITDHRIYELPGWVRLEFNRQTVTTDPVIPFKRLTQEAVVVNYESLVIGRAQVGYLNDPCST
jgi:hypothetical protein